MLDQNAPFASRVVSKLEIYCHSKSWGARKLVWSWNFDKYLHPSNVTRFCLHAERKLWHLWSHFAVLLVFDSCLYSLNFDALSLLWMGVDLLNWFLRLDSTRTKTKTWFRITSELDCHMLSLISVSKWKTLHSTIYSGIFAHPDVTPNLTYVFTLCIIWQGKEKNGKKYDFLNSLSSLPSDESSKK